MNDAERGEWWPNWGCTRLHFAPEADVAAGTFTGAPALCGTWAHNPARMRRMGWAVPLLDAGPPRCANCTRKLATPTAPTRTGSVPTEEDQ